MKGSIVMNRSKPGIAALALATAVLGLTGCGKGKDASAVSGEPIASIAAPQGKVWADVIGQTPEGGYRMGNPDAPIKLVEYASITCSHCAEFSEASMPALRDTFVNSGRVSYEFRNFVRDPIDLTAAQLTRCGAPETFFALTEQVLANQTEMFSKAQAAGEAAYSAAMSQPPATRGAAIARLTGLTEFFAARGISVDQANACLADTKAAQALAEMAQKQGEQFEITGTPTFIINGEKADANTWDVIKNRLEAMGAR
ncbi:MAG: DsbA family protein [Novosphingobium sp.]|nr:DsbA family protein [Novosphingobium sp.]